MAETVASYTVPEHHVIQFTDNVRAALNRQGGDMRMHVTQASYVGEKSQVVNFLGPISFTKRDTPYSDTVVTEVQHKQRWVTADEYDCAVFVDRLDTLKMIYDPTSPYVERMREAAARKEDDIIMSNFYSAAKTGKQGTETITFPNADIIVHGTTGMSVAKLRSARKLLKKRHVNLRSEMPLIATTAQQIDDLLGEVAVGSNDYNAVKPLVDGEVSRFMGFMFIPHEDFDEFGIPTHDDTGTVRECPVWVPSGMHYGNWQELVITINNRADKNNIKQAHATFTAGGTRLEEGRVLKLECKEP